MEVGLKDPESETDRYGSCLPESPARGLACRLCSSGVIAGPLLPRRPQKKRPCGLARLAHLPRHQHPWHSPRAASASFTHSAFRQDARCVDGFRRRLGSLAGPLSRVALIVYFILFLSIYSRGKWKTFGLDPRHVLSVCVNSHRPFCHHCVPWTAVDPSCDPLAIHIT
jgi:hypothetical protein